MIFLINPDGGSSRMARKKLPPRDKRGRFKRGGRKAAAPRKRKASRARASRSTTTRRTTTTTTRRRNPAKQNLVGDLIDGVADAGGVIAGRIGARSLPQVLGIQQAGNMGLLIQVLVAIAGGWIADQFLSKNMAKMILAGGLTAPLETLAVAMNVPFVAEALSPAVAQQALEGYSGGLYPRMGRYPRNALGAYPRAGGAALMPGVPSSFAGYGGGTLPGEEYEALCEEC